MTVIFVTHSIIEAAFLAQRAVVLTRRPARIVLDHRLDLPERRTAALRTDPQFAQQMRVLFEALERGTEPDMSERLILSRNVAAAARAAVVVTTVARRLAVRQGWVPSFLVPAPSSVVLLDVS